MGVVAACAPVPPPGLSVSEAVAAARREFAFALTEVVAVQRTTFASFQRAGEYVPGDPRRDVWKITIRGHFSLPCPMAASGGPTEHCAPDADTMSIVIDASDGSFLFARTPG